VKHWKRDWSWVYEQFTENMEMIRKQWVENRGGSIEESDEVISSQECGFWATVCKPVRPMLSDRCLSCLWRWCSAAKRLDGSR